MTEELEQKAIKASDKKCVKGCSKYYRYGFQDGYIAGAIENGIQWHYLRKDPNDLPKDDKNYLIITDDGNYYIAKHYHNDNYWVCKVKIYVSLIKHVVAWCELPEWEIKEND